MEEFIRGPFALISLLLFVAGMVCRGYQIFRLTGRKERQYYTTAKVPKTAPPADKKRAPDPVPTMSDEQRYGRIARFRNSMLGKHPVMAVVTTVFHACLLVVPVFLVAHNLILREMLGFRLPTLPDGVSDFLTIVFLACCLFFLMRRLVLPTVFAVSSFSDYFLLFLTALPFLTGFLAYHHLFTYKYVILLHMVSGELMLIVAPFTKLGHVAFFFVARFFIDGEYVLGRGDRKWSVNTNG